MWKGKEENSNSEKVVDVGNRVQRVVLVVIIVSSRTDVFRLGKRINSLRNA